MLVQSCVLYPDPVSAVCCRRRCYLKRVITMPAPPKVTKLSHVVSGFSLRNCAHTHTT